MKKSKKHQTDPQSISRQNKAKQDFTKIKAILTGISAGIYHISDCLLSLVIQMFHVTRHERQWISIEPRVAKPSNNFFLCPPLLGSAKFLKFNCNSANRTNLQNSVKRRDNVPVSFINNLYLTNRTKVAAIDVLRQMGERKN